MGLWKTTFLWRHKLLWSVCVYLYKIIEINNTLLKIVSTDLITYHFTFIPLRLKKQTNKKKNSFEISGWIFTTKDTVTFRSFPKVPIPNPTYIGNYSICFLVKYTTIFVGMRKDIFIFVFEVLWSQMFK